MPFSARRLSASLPRSSDIHAGPSTRTEGVIVSMLFALDSLSPLIVATVVGQVFPSDWRDGVAVLVTDPTMPRTAGVLVDLRRADVAVSVEDVGWMAAVLHRLHARFAGRVALLTAAVGRATPAALLASYADGVRFRLQSFTDEPAARSWLAVGN